MPRPLTSYRVFIASPGKLEALRHRFRETVAEYNRLEAMPRGVYFEPIGWEATLPGYGRPQKLINDELRTCDYAVFLFRDRWGSPPDKEGCFSSGCEEEWTIADQMCNANEMSDAHLFFLPVEDGQLNDPGPQFSALLKFRAKIEAEKKYLFKQLKADDEFASELRAALASWLRSHEGGRAEKDETDLNRQGSKAAVIVPQRPESITTKNKGAVPELLRRAINQLDAGQLDIGLAFAEAAFSLADEQKHQVYALHLQGYALIQLGRGEEAVATYDALLASFGAATELPLRELVAKAMFNKGVALGELGRGEEELATYDALRASFGAATELPLREEVAQAMFNKGVALGKLGRSEEAMATYDEIINNFQVTESELIGSFIEKALRRIAAARSR